MGYEMKDVGYEMKDVGYEMKDVGYEMKDVGYEMKDVGYGILNDVVRYLSRTNILELHCHNDFTNDT
jgi:isopropylmalate/homocitrate/citramalate synthase